MNFNISKPLYIRSFTTDNIKASVGDGILLQNNMFGSCFINIVYRYTPLASGYYPIHSRIWKSPCFEKEFLMDCRSNFPSLLKELLNYVVTLDDSLNDDVVVIAAENIPMASRHNTDIEFLIMDIGYWISANVMSIK
jgi:hypothetical protein